MRRPGPSPAQLDPTIPLASLGVDSLLALEVRNAVVRAFAVPLPPTFLFDHPSVAALATALIAPALAPAPPPPASGTSAALSVPLGAGISIDGMACRFPACGDVSRGFSLCAHLVCISEEETALFFSGRRRH